MKSTVLVVGEKFRYSTDFLEALKRKIHSKLPKIDSFVFIKENDPNILVELENYIASSSNIIIAAQKNSFALIGKMLSTHMLDTLVPRGDMLVPSKCKEYVGGSYLVTIQSRLINALRIDTASDIPEILIEEQRKIKKIFILDSDEERTKLLVSPLATASEIATTIYKNPSGFIELVAEEKKYGKLDSFLAKTQKLFDGKAILSDSLETYLINSLSTQNKKLAVAESCTGGLLSYKFVRVPGASDVLIGSLTTYANEAKISWLSVDENTIDNHGAVSEESVSQMVDGLLRISGADYAVAISGIAGPGGGSVDKPVGLVYIGVANLNGAKKIEKNIFFGDRELIQSSAANYALKMLCEIFQEN